jgi:uracil-DNA glycosylase
MTQKMHRSWDSLKRLLYRQPLVDLPTILSEISYKPEKEKIFRAFECNLSDVKVVILGQDPYPRGWHACGYAFVNGMDIIPQSLKVIYQELKDDGFESPYARGWPDQGVLMLNTALTVETNKPNSHKKYWEEFTKETVKLISSQQPCIWMLWGRNAKSYVKHIKNPIDVNSYGLKHIEEIPISPDLNYILEAAHPVSEKYGNKGGFLGCKHFSKTNRLLEKLGKTKIIWNGRESQQV